MLNVLGSVDERIVVWSGGIGGRNYVFWKVGYLFWEINCKWGVFNG